MVTVIGKKLVELSSEQFLLRASSFRAVLIDIGTGDGKFVYRYAGAHPDTLTVGIDAVRERMRDISGKAARKPARGGLSNCIFVEAAVESLPAEMVGVADRLTVNYPWGSLLSAFVLPDLAIIKNLRRLAKRCATLDILLNYSVFEDDAYMQRLNLPSFNQQEFLDRVAPMLHECAIDVVSTSVFTGEPPQWTSWGKRLVAGSDRKTMAISAIVRA